MGQLTSRSITRRPLCLWRPRRAPEALLDRPNTGQGKRRGTERICLTAVATGGMRGGFML
eukprot:scaffold71233_cov64-Phaeocystis_antarctica.AAC.2